MNEEILVSYITSSISNLNAKIENSDKNTVKLFSYMYASVNSHNTDINNRINTISEDQQLYDAKISAMTSKNDLLADQIQKLSNVIADKDAKISMLTDELKELKNTINKFEAIGKDYIYFPRKSFILKFANKIHSFFYMLIHSKEIKEAQLKAEQERIEQECIAKEQEAQKKAQQEYLAAEARRKEAQKKKEARDRMKNILNNM